MLRRVLRGNIRRVLLLLVLVTLVPVVIGQAVIICSRVRARQAEELRANLELARALAVAVDAYVRNVVRQELAVGEAITSPTPMPSDEATRYLRRLSSQQEGVRHYAWVTPDGRVAVSGHATGAGIDLADRGYFRAIAAGREWAVSDILVSRIDGRPTVVIARGIRGAGGTLQGVVAASVDPDALGEVLDVERAREGAVIVMDTQGRVIYRNPAVPWTWDRRLGLAENDLTRRALSGEAATGAYRSRIDNSDRFGAFVPIGSIGWVAQASRPVSEVMQPLLQTTLREAVLLLLAVAAALSLALVVAAAITRSVRRLREEVLAYGSGEVRRVSVTGPAELEDLAGAFNRMAASLEERAAERDRLMERFRLQAEELAEANAAKDRFLNVISHELRNPLAAITAGVGFLNQALPHEGRSAHVLEIVERNVELETHLVEDLLEFSRAALGKLEIRRSPVSLERVVNSVAEALGAEAESASVSLTVEAPPHLWVHGDAKRIEEAVGQLVSNAIKFTPAGGSARVVVGECDGHPPPRAVAPAPQVSQDGPPAHSEAMACIMVEDTGAGIAPELRSHLFEMLRQGSPADARTPGLGIGLYLARRLIELHGGRVWAESEGPGKGSRFTLTLPLLAATAGRGGGEGVDG